MVLVNIRAFTDIHLKNIISFKVYVHSKNKVFEIENLYETELLILKMYGIYLPTCYNMDILIELKIKTNYPIIEKST